MEKYYAYQNDEVTSLERENQEAVRKNAGEYMVLLENNGVLPLGTGGKNIALYGNGVRHTIKGGTGSGDVNTRQVVNVQQGFEAAGFTVTTQLWLDAYDRRLDQAMTQYMDTIRQMMEEKNVPALIAMMGMPFTPPEIPEITDRDVEASQTDTAIYVLSRNSGEGSDRRYEKGDYLLSDSEEAALRFLGSRYKNFIVLLNTGGIIDTTVLRAIPGIDALMVVGQTGNMGGHMIADVVTGVCVPSGKLTDTWAADYFDYPSSASFSHNNGNLEDEYYTEGIYVGYRYFDTFGVTPNYCFGYGKGYTDFSMAVTEIVLEKNKVKIYVDVENTGDQFPGKEVVQVYYSAPEGSLKKPFQELAAFEKTPMLAPGEKAQLCLSFSLEDMASYSEDAAAWLLEEGDYILRVGNSSRNTRICGAVRLEKTVITKQLKNCFPDDIKLEEIRPKEDQSKEDQPKEALLKADPADISYEEAVYTKEHPVYLNHSPQKTLTLEDVRADHGLLEDFIAQMSVEDMADLCVGAARSGGANIVGNAGRLVPGAAGETISRLEDTKKIPPVIMADGPAGLRLQPHFKAMPDGTLIPGGKIRGNDREPFPENVPKEAIDYYQYCTAIPVASTLAQSWNMDLVESMGALVGREMKQFHIHLWLAPGMNIHRNPLCGRNFEYYSEDPRLSGRCAAACTRGVQSHGGQGTTIKHFAANNQEDNRMFTNAHISERALREIYLKGFEIAVKESQPYAIMTSYNLINGIHAANNYDLLQSVARDEWGFKGIVMTDWYTSQDTAFMGLPSGKYSWSDPALCIKAGNDLQMPGCDQNAADIVSAIYSKKVLSLGDLQFTVRNLLELILKVTQ